MSDGNQPTPEELKGLEDSQARRDEFVRLQFREDCETVLGMPAGRRILRFALGPQVTNLLGNNSPERDAGVALLDTMNASLADNENDLRERVLTKLFASKEEDENGWY